MFSKLFSHAARLNWHFAIIFVALPIMLYIYKPHSWIYLVLWVMAVYCVTILWWRNEYSFKKDWNWQALTKPVIKTIFLRFLPFAAALTIFAYAMLPDGRFLSLPLDRPWMWIMVMIWYPALSVIPQEIIFRSFFFRKYALWFARSPQFAMIANAFAFGWMHIILHNWVAVVFSAIGSYLFADTYRKTKSLAVVCFEHALYGCFLFTLGMGYYFYHGQAVK